MHECLSCTTACSLARTSATVEASPGTQINKVKRTLIQKSANAGGNKQVSRQQLRAWLLSGLLRSRRLSHYDGSRRTFGAAHLQKHTKWRQKEGCNELQHGQRQQALSASSENISICLHTMSTDYATTASMTIVASSKQITCLADVCAGECHLGGLVRSTQQADRATRQRYTCFS